MKNEDEENFISGIHNYCDRWCERCAFIERCRVGAAEARMTDEERDPDSEAFWRNLANIFAEAQTMLIAKAEEFGIEIQPISDEDFEKHRQREGDFVENQELSALSERYWKEVRQTLNNRDFWIIFAPTDEETSAEMLEIISWYQFFIAAKIRRGFHSLLDINGTYKPEELDDTESNANGSIKIALIAVERSIMAWTALMSPENAQTIAPCLNLLEKIKRQTDQKFPHAYDFIRPGFDKVNEIMM